MLTVVRQCALVCFGAMALEGGLNAGGGILWLDNLKMFLALAGFLRFTKSSIKGTLWVVLFQLNNVQL